jgi:hypothetical protein
MFKVLLVCYNNWDTTAEIPYILKKGGCTVDVYSSPSSWAITNSYYDNWIERGEPDLKDYISKLISHVKTTTYDWVILCDDAIIKYLNDNIVDEELFAKLMPINLIENRYMLSSKTGFSDFCETYDILTPAYFKYNSPDDLEKIKEKLNFPVIIKMDFSSAGAGMFMCNNYDDFYIKSKELPLNENVLIQEYIAGEEIHVEGLFYNGILVNYQTAYTIERVSHAFSYKTRKKYFQSKEIGTLLAYLGKSLGLNSVANICYIYNVEQNKYYLFEVDPRPNSCMAYARFMSENDFANGVKRIINGEYVNGIIDTPWKKPHFELALFYKDIRRIYWKKDFKGLLRWVFNMHGYWRFLPFYDAKLSKRVFKLLFYEFVTHRIQSAFKRKK